MQAPEAGGVPVTSAGDHVGWLILRALTIPNPFAPLCAVLQPHGTWVERLTCLSSDRVKWEGDAESKVLPEVSGKFACGAGLRQHLWGHPSILLRH